MKKLVVVVILLLLAAWLPAQTVSPPPSTVLPAPAPADATILVNPLSNVLQQNSSWTLWAGGAITTLGQNQFADEAKLKTLSDQSAAITDLQNRITALEAVVKALQSKVQSAGSTLATP